MHKLIEQIKNEGLLVLPNITFEEYVNLLNEIGYLDDTEIFCSLPNYNYIWRVTNQKVNNYSQGLFRDKHIDWHSNITYSLDGPECIALRAENIDENKCSPTTFNNTIPYYKSLDKNTQELFDRLYVKYSIYHEKTIENVYSNVHDPAGDNIEDDKNKKLQETNKHQSIKKSVNIPKDELNLYKDGRFALEGKWKLVPNHPLGTKGLFFPHMHVVDIVDEYDNSYKDLYYQLKEDLIESTKYHYVHNWKNNDLLLADQLVGTHKRDRDIKDQIREMHLVQFWYQTKDRIHYEYSL